MNMLPSAGMQEATLTGRSPSQGRVDGDLPEIEPNHCLFQGNTLLLLPESERQGRIEENIVSRINGSPILILEFVNI